MNTTHNPDGTVTVTSRGHHRLSELLDAAALAFAHKRETAVDWPALVRTTELGADHFASTFALPGSLGSSASAAPTFELTNSSAVPAYALTAV